MFATKTGASFRTMSVASSRRGSSMQRVIISLALATLAACKPPAADEAMARTMVTHALIGPSAPPASPDSEGAVWSASKVPGRILYGQPGRSEEHTSDLQSLMRTSYAFFGLKKKKPTQEKQYR